MEKQKNLQIQGLRGLAILCIMIFHYYVRYQMIYVEDYPGSNLSFLSSVGVTTFFLISGYYLDIPYGGFSLVKKRLKSLWIKYLGAISIIFVITRFVELPGRTVTFPEYLINFFFVNEYLGVPYVDGAHWFLKTLVISILYYSIILTFSERIRELFYLVWIGLILVPSAIMGLGNETTISGIIVLQKISRIMLGYFLDANAIPIIVGTLLHKNSWNMRNITTSMFALLYFVIYKDSISTVILIGCSVIVFLAGKGKMRLLELQPLVFLGEISYSIYLLHQNIGYIILRLLGEFELIKILVPIFCSILIAFIYDKLFSIIRYYITEK